MKNFIYTFFFSITVIVVYAGDPVSLGKKALAKQSLPAGQAGMNAQPVRFMENKGQMINTNYEPVPFVLFKAEAPGINLYVTEKGLTYTFVKIEKKEREKKEMLKGDDKEKRKVVMAWMNMHLKGATIKKENIIKEGESREHFNYFLGHCPDGIYGVKQYEKITVRDVYPNIDWVLYNSNGKGFKYDFIVHSNADPSQIKLIYEGEYPLEMDNEGNLHIKTQLGELTEKVPYSYIRETGQQINSHFSKRKIDEYRTEVTFSLPYGEGWGGASLIIDPELVWGTFYGANGHDGFECMAHDNNDNLFITGYTESFTYPVQDTDTYFQDSPGFFIGVNAVILKFDDNGNRLWATYYGGNVGEGGKSITCDNLGNIFVTGWSGSTNLPRQNSGTFFQGTFGGGPPGSTDAFILKFDNNGEREWATYYGGNDRDAGNSIVCDDAGNVFITGYTRTLNPSFPLLNAGTYFDNTRGGNQDAFILKFDNAGNRLWATYYGGSNDEEAYSITCDNSGNVFITGDTRSSDFPFLNAGTYCDSVFGGNRDAFISKFDNAGDLLWATYYGGSSSDQGFTIACDNLENVFVVGPTGSDDFPLQDAGTYFDDTLRGNSDAFVLKFDNDGNCLWSTYYGGSGNEFYWLSSYNNITFLNDPCKNINNSIVISFETTSFDITTFYPGCGFIGTTYAGGNMGLGDLALVQFTNSGELLWSTYIGHNQTELKSPLSADSRNNLFLGGEWISYPSGAGLPLADPGGSAYYDATPNGADDSFILKFERNIPTYSQSQQDPAGCLCDGSATITLNCGYPPYIYTWSNGVQSMNDSTGTHSISGLCPGEIYTVTVYMNCDTIQASYIMGGTTDISVSPDENICIGSSTTLVASGATTYSWSPATGLSDITGAMVTASPTATTTYTLIGSDGASCSDTAYVTVTVYPLPVVNAGSNSPVCENDTINLTASGGISYSWTGPGNYSGNIQYPVIPNAAVMNDGTYTVTVTDANGCMDSTSMNVTINLLPEVSFSVSPESACVPHCVLFENKTPNTSTALWQFGDGKSGYEETKFHCYPDPGSYNVTLTINGSNGCVNTKSVPDLIHAFPNPVALFSTTPPQYALVSVPVLFHNESSGTGQWLWNFGPPEEGNTSVLRDPSFAFDEPGTYTVILIVSSNEGCTDTISHTIIVEPDFTLYIPNAFTPDNDGLNDLFGPQGAHFDSFEMEIFNRWGESVAHPKPSHGEGRHWDGTAEGGVPAPQGVYIYKILVKDFKGEMHVYVGNVTLIR